MNPLGSAIDGCLYFFKEIEGWLRVHTPRKASSTIVEIAKELDVAHSTVSRALANSPLISDATKRKVWELAKKMNYVKNPFANGLRTGKTQIIELQYFTIAEHLYQDPILLTFMDACQQQLQLCDYQLMLNIIRSRKTLLKTSISKRDVSDGHILVSSLKLPISYRDKLNPASCVIVDNQMPNYSTVNFDMDDIMQQLIDNIVQQHRKRIVGIIHDPRGRESLQRRVKRYQKICEQRKNEVNDLGVLTLEASGNILEKGRQLLKHAQGVICLSDDAIDGCIRYAKEENVRIPQDILIAGIVDIKMNTLKSYRIPMVLLDWPELARQAVLMLLTLLNAEIQSPLRKLVKCQLQM